MKLIYFFFSLALSFGVWAQDQACVDKATREYDECIELATEVLENKEEGVTTDRHSRKEGKELKEGGCKKIYDKDLAACKKSE